MYYFLLVLNLKIEKETSKMSSLCLSFSTKILQHHAFFQYSFYPLPPWPAHLAAQSFKFSIEIKIATTCFNLQLNGQGSLDHIYIIYKEITTDINILLLG